MKDKTFRRLLAGILLLGSIATAALAAYTYHLQKVCSIISYIANGR